MSVVLCYIEVGLDLTGVEANIMMMRMLLSTKRSLIVINDSGHVKKKKKQEMICETVKLSRLLCAIAPLARCFFPDLFKVS